MQIAVILQMSNPVLAVVAPDYWPCCCFRSVYVRVDGRSAGIRLCWILPDYYEDCLYSLAIETDDANWESMQQRANWG